ncbi:hypothetical protein J6590_005029 [Homalodisca vitripennis]|nr:hypothetical protein J6590_005029 [Homalodisca vitripennis]
MGNNNKITLITLLINSNHLLKYPASKMITEATESHLTHCTQALLHPDGQYWIQLQTITSPGLISWAEGPSLVRDFPTTTNGRGGELLEGELLARTGSLSGHPPKQQPRSTLLHHFPLYVGEVRVSSSRPDDDKWLAVLGGAAREKTAGAVPPNHLVTSLRDHQFSCQMSPGDEVCRDQDINTTTHTVPAAEGSINVKCEILAYVASTADGSARFCYL